MYLVETIGFACIGTYGMDSIMAFGKDLGIRMSIAYPGLRGILMAGQNGQSLQV
jgi:hypothetical protein